MDDPTEPVTNDKFQPGDQVAAKLRGFPWRTTLEEFSEFLAKHKTIEGSFIVGKTEEGRRSGMAAVLFENEEVAEKAVKELDKEYIGERYVMVYAMTYGQYLKFNVP